MGKHKKLKRKFKDYQFECEGRFDKIEKHLGLNTEVSVSKNELTELPENWFIEITKENKKLVNEWLKKENLKEGAIAGMCKWSSGITQKEFNFSRIIKKEGYDFGIEITFDQFKKWVLKEDDSKTFEIEVIKPLSIREVQVKVTSQEEANECAEIAKACGEKIEGKFSMTINWIDNYFRFGNINFGCYLKSSTQKQISIQEYRERFGKPKEIDWSKPWQFVINKNNAVWRTTGNHNNHFFEGILIRLSHKSDKPNSELFKTKNNIVKEIFKLCTEPITLKNE